MLEQSPWKVNRQSTDQTVLPGNKKYTVLVIDHLMHRGNAIKAGLETKINANVSVFNDGLEVWKYLRGQSDVNLIVMNIITPHLTGLSVVGMMKGSKSLSSIPVVLYSADKSALKQRLSDFKNILYCGTEDVGSVCDFVFRIIRGMECEKKSAIASPGAFDIVIDESPSLIESLMRHYPRGGYVRYQK